VSPTRALAVVPQHQDPTAVTGIHTVAPAGDATPDRPMQIQIRLRLRPGISPGAMEVAAARLPAVYAGAVLAGEHDLELRLACRDAADLSASIAELRRCGAAECQVEVVLRGFFYPQPPAPPAALELAPPHQSTP
jgi:hypothetical protein